jgi:hypothetical protein
MTDEEKTIKENVRFGQRIQVRKNAPFFREHFAYIAYIGESGVSVYLEDSSFDDCIPLKWDEFLLV